MKDMMSYKGYYGSVHYSDEDGVFHGKIEFIRSLVTYCLLYTSLSPRD